MIDFSITELLNSYKILNIRKINIEVWDGLSDYIIADFINDFSDIFFKTSETRFSTIVINEIINNLWVYGDLLSCDANFFAYIGI